MITCTIGLGSYHDQFMVYMSAVWFVAINDHESCVGTVSMSSFPIANKFSFDELVTFAQQFRKCWAVHLDTSTGPGVLDLRACFCLCRCRALRGFKGRRGGSWRRRVEHKRLCAGGPLTRRKNPSADASRNCSRRRRSASASSAVRCYGLGARRRCLAVCSGERR